MVNLLCTREVWKINRKILPSIYNKALVGLILIQLTHKAVHEIPGMFQIDKTSVWIYSILQIILYISAIILISLRKDEWSLLPGIIASVMLLIQPALRLMFILLNIKVDDHGDVWWYPVFPVVQGGLILYFSWLAWKELQVLKKGSSV